MAAACPRRAFFCSSSFAYLFPRASLPVFSSRALTFGSSAFTVFGLDCLVAAAASLYYSTTIQNGVLVFRVLAATLAVLGVGLLIAGALRHRNRA